MLLNQRLIVIAKQRGVLNISMSEIGLQGAGIVAVIRELVPTSMAKQTAIPTNFRARCTPKG
jgi:hypothetical protein